jgi:Transposase IS4
MKEHNRGLVWNSALAEIVESTLCFLWQDNNAVLSLTTAHYFKDDTVERLRKRPAPTSTNARIIRPVFRDLPAKWLRIPRAIDDYNHYMNGVDRSNQLRGNFTAHRAYERRVWRPLWYYILDVCAVNSYLIWKGDIKDKSKRGQRLF